MIELDGALDVAVGSDGCFVIVGNGTAVLVGRMVGWLVIVGKAVAANVLIGVTGRLVTVGDTTAVITAAGVFVGINVGWTVAVGALRVGEAGISVAVAEAACVAVAGTVPPTVLFCTVTPLGLFTTTAAKTVLFAINTF